MRTRREDARLRGERREARVDIRVTPTTTTTCSLEETLIHGDGRVINGYAGRPWSALPARHYGVLKAAQFLVKLVQPVDEDGRLTARPTDDAAV